MKTLVYLVFGLLVSSRTGYSQNTNGDLYDDYNNDEDYTANDGDEDDMPNSPIPTIVSSHQDLEVKPGSKVLLPCKIDHVDAGIVEWYFNSVRIYMEDERMIDEPRYSKTVDALIIDGVTEKDSGNYTCALVNEIKFLSHTLSVSTPVRIEEFITTRDNISLPDRSYTSHAVWLKGSRQRISCVAKGYPPPTVVISHLWMHGKHKAGEIETLVGNPIIIDPVERKHSGKYICTASSDGNTVDKSLQVEVDYAPEVHMKKDYIATAEGIETAIVCRVQAHPSANVYWMRNTDRLENIKRDLIEDKEGANHILRIFNTVESDFGIYTCIATNSLGTANKTARVSGKPSRPIIESADFDDDLITPVLTWKIESQVPLEEYKLEYKKQETNDWYDIKKVRDAHPSNPDNNYIVKHKFEDLEEGTYHARIKAKNKYGWSEDSIEKTFSGNKVLPRTANTFSQLESVRQGTGTEVRISLALVLSLLIAHLLH